MTFVFVGVQIRLENVHCVTNLYNKNQSKAEKLSANKIEHCRIVSVHWMTPV